MRLSKEILAALSVVCLTSGVAFAGDCNTTADVQAYAHPTLFSAQGHSILTGDVDQVTTGAKIYKPCNAITVTGKDNVVIGREAKKQLADMKSKMDAARANGARGGTIINARGAGGKQVEKVLGLTIAQEKEIIIILCSKEERNPIMSAIVKAVG